MGIKKPKKLKERYDKLELDVFAALVYVVENSEHESKHMNCKALPINVFDYTELVFDGDRLRFLDHNGHHYSVYNECSLEDLIDILNKM